MNAAINWLFAVIKYPLTFNEHLKLLKEINNKLDSPSRYKDSLEFIDKAYAIKLKLLVEEKDKLAISESTKKEALENLIKRLEQAKADSETMIEQNRKLTEQRNIFHNAFKASERAREILNEELKKNKLGSLFPQPPSLQDTLEQAMQEGAFSKFAPWLAPDKK